MPASRHESHVVIDFVHSRQCMCHRHFLDLGRYLPRPREVGQDLCAALCDGDMKDPILLPYPIDLDAPDNYLMSDFAPDDSMRLSDLDEFLTGIAVGPELIAPITLVMHQLSVSAPSIRCPFLES